MTSAIPTLSTFKWVTDPYEKADKLLAYYFSTDAGEAFTFFDRLTSIHYTISKFGHDPQSLKRQVHNDIENIFSKYFDVVQPNVLIVDDNDSSYTLVISVNFDENDHVYSTSKRLRVEDSILKSVIDVNNEG